MKIITHDLNHTAHTINRVLGIYNFGPTPKLVSHVVHVFQREVEKRLTIFRRALYTSEKDPWPMISWVFGTISTILIYDGIDTYDKKWLTASEILSITASTHCSNKVCPLLLELTLCFLRFVCTTFMQWCNNFTSFLKNIQSCCFVDPSFSGQCNELIRSTWPRSKTHGPLPQLQQPPAAAVRRYSTVRNGGDDNTAAATTRWAF